MECLAVDEEAGVVRMTQEQIMKGLICCIYKLCGFGCPYSGMDYCRYELKTNAEDMLEGMRKTEELADAITIKLQGGCE